LAQKIWRSIGVKQYPPKSTFSKDHYFVARKKNFYARKQLLLSARLSRRNSVRLSVTRVDQSKTVQDRISKSSPSLPGRF